MYQALSHFSVLQATESWAGPGNEANWFCSSRKCTCLVYFSSLSASAVVTSYCNLILQAALDWMSKGHMLADAVAIIGK